MVPWLHLDSATLPDGGGELRLMRRAPSFRSWPGAIELMNSRLSGSEEALATMTCARIAGRPKPHLLIGGLGMGFTLRAALAELPVGARVTVAELAPAVLGWARGPMAEIFAGSLDDPRVDIRQTDVGALIGSATAGYDAIVLDVDNGPQGLTRPANDGLYDARGLGAARTALRPGGVLAVWSSARHDTFTPRLKRAGFAVEEVPVRAHRGRGARHLVWLAIRPG